MQPQTPEPVAVMLLPEAQADLRRLRSLAPRFLKQLQSLATRPERGHPLRGNLSGCRSLVLSHEGGGYRAVYVYDRSSNRCLVFAIGEHAGVYDVARQRFPPAHPGDSQSE